MTPEIREAGPQDRAAVQALFDALQAVELEMEPNRLPPGQTQAHVDRLIDQASRGGFVLLAGEAGEAPGALLIGVLEDEGAYVLPENRPHGVISDLYVAPPLRRRGLALAMLREAERRFAEAGVRRVEIGALAGNEAALSLYRRWAGAPYAVLFAKAAQS